MYRNVVQLDLELLSFFTHTHTHTHTMHVHTHTHTHTHIINTVQAYSQCWSEKLDEGLIYTLKFDYVH